MGDFAAHLWAYVWAVISGWFGLVGVVLGVVEIAGRLGGRRTPRVLKKLPFGWVAAVCLFFASFQAWNAERLKQPLPNEAALYDRIQKLEARLAPRRLTEAQRAMLLNTLPAPVPEYTVKVHSTGESDRESLQYALDFVEVFRAKGWNVVEHHGSIMMRLPGIVIAVKDERDQVGIKVVSAILGAGIPLAEAHESPGVPPKQISIYVGEKPD